MKTIKRAIRSAWKMRRGITTAIILPAFLLETLAPYNLLQAADTSSSSLPAPVSEKPVVVNKHVPKGHYAGPSIPDSPTDEEVTLCHAFAEPPIPVGAVTTPGENQALASAIKQFLNRASDEDLTSLEGFVSANPNSAWTASVGLNLAELYYTTGYFSKAMSAWQDAWDKTKDLKDDNGVKIGNLALAKLAKMKARVGRMDELGKLFEQSKGRALTGSAAQLWVEAKDGYWIMQKQPERGFKCGPAALYEILLSTTRDPKGLEIMRKAASTTQGISLKDVNRYAAEAGMGMQMAKRTSGAPFLVPSVVHWGLGHYAAIVAQRDGKYEIHDETFGKTQFLVSAAALENESTGYFIVPQGALPKGWTTVSDDEGAKVFGRGSVNAIDPTAFGVSAGNSTGDPNGTGAAGGDCGGNADSTNHTGNRIGDTSSSGAAMTVPFVKSMTVSLNLVDTPVRYSPPVGPHMHFTVQYNQRDNTQPATFSYGNMGPGWTYSYLSYVTPGSSTTTVYLRGGGVETYYYNSPTSTWLPSQDTQAVLSKVNSTTWQVALSGGEIETYGQADGSGHFYLTKITDAQGNSLTLTYDSHFRLTALTDALGQVTTVSYASTVSTQLPEFYQIAKVTDPFGRYAQFSYNYAGQLEQITDIMGIRSSFAYALGGNFVSALTTPYGTTSFSYGDSTTNPSWGGRWLNTTYPDGKTTRTEYDTVLTSISSTDSAGPPAGMYSPLGGNQNENAALNFYNTFYWDKQAFANYAGNYAKARVTHWMGYGSVEITSEIPESEKSCEENRTWYYYSGSTDGLNTTYTASPLPNAVGRVLDNGASQVSHFTYNAIGKKTSEVDPLGRETDYAYATNGIDLLTVKQKNGSGWDLLKTCTYNTQHEPLTATGADGQTTTNTYYSNGKIHTMTDPKGDVTTMVYDSNWNLTSVTGAVSGATISYTYDAYDRRKTVTDAQGYTTTTLYDAMDRPTQVTYPDGTTSQMAYTNLDLTYSKDRMGRWMRHYYNSVEQEIATLDSLGHSVTTAWTLSAGISSILDSNGNLTGWKYDDQNRPIEKDYPGGNKIQTAYENTTSRVKTTTDPKGQIATPTYNLDSSVAQVAYTNATISTPTVSFTYDSVYPRVATMTDGVGTTTYTYNPVNAAVGANMLASVSVPVAGSTATLSYTYDQLERVVTHSVDGSANSETITPDALGRTSTDANNLTPGGSFSYGYLGTTGRVTSLTNPNGLSTQYTYQDSTTTPNEPRLTEIKNLNTSSGVISKFDYGYDANNEITTWTQQTDSNDPQAWAMQYDAESKVTNVNVTDTTTSAILHQYAYSFDAVGNRTTEQVDGNVVTSSYNGLNQLTGQAAGGAMVFSGNISKAGTVTVGGNPASVDASFNFRGTAAVTTGTNNVPVVATSMNGYPATNNYQVVVPPASSSNSYDANGNLLSDGSRTFAWDAKNELVSITYTDGSSSNFTYNGSGGRVCIVEKNSSGTVTSTKWFVGNEERDATNTVTRRYFAQGEQQIVGGTATNYFYARDHLGSIRELVDSSGTVQARYSYDPYGRRTKVSGTIDSDYGFGGYLHHAPSGLDLTPARAYDSNLGRWISRDPSGELSGINLYAYCGGDPVNKIDPTGLCAIGHERLRALAVQYLVNNEDYPEWWAEIVVDTGDWAIQNSTALEAANDVLIAAQMLDGVGEVEAVGGLARSAIVSPENAEALLMASGRSAEQAADYVASFTGPITARIVESGETFLRYTDAAASKGSFLTKTIFNSPGEAVEGLYLGPYGNTASLLQTVTSTGRSIILEGGVANGGEGIIQSLIVNRNAFEFGTGLGF